MPIPSTTNTFAIKMKTLKEGYIVQKKWSVGYEPSADHAKFIELNQRKIIVFIAEKIVTAIVLNFKYFFGKDKIEESSVHFYE